jgi:hypothetical protein
MSLKISEKANLNYLAKVVKLTNLRKHPNADKLQITTIDGNNIITGLDAKDGDLYVYFSLESSINLNYISFSNGFRESSLNTNKEVVGFFEPRGRVRAISLRGEKSCGYICPVKNINEWLNTFTSFNITEEHQDVEFDMICDTVMCEKYINREALLKILKANKTPKGIKKLAKETKLIEGQFAFHVDTAHLQKYIYKINPHDIIHISKKLHGTSAIVGNILCKRKLSLKDSIARFFGVNVNETEYQLIWSSRTVVKNGNYYLSWQETLWKNFLYYLSSYKKPFESWVSLILAEGDQKREEFFGDLQYHRSTPLQLYKDLQEWSKIIKNPQTSNHYYSYDIWRDVAIQLEDFLYKGMTFYCEVVGYTKEGAYLQKGYDYGCDLGNFAIYIYRITYTNPSGKIFEFSTQQVKAYCNKLGLNMVPELYYGRAKDLFDIPVDDNWHDNFIELVSQNYLEKDCDMCVNKVPDEGIVLRKEDIDIEPYKYISFAFKLRETKNADNGEIDLETIESEQLGDA